MVYTGDHPHYTNRQFIKDFWNVLGKQKFTFFFWTFVRLLTSILSLIPPIAIAKIIDFFTTYSTGQSLRTFYFWCGVLIIAAITATLTRLGSKYQLGNISRTLQKNIVLTAFSSLLNYNLEWHEKESSGNKMQRIQTGKEGIKSFMYFLSQYATDILIGIVGVIIAFAAFNWKYALLVLLYVIAYLSFENYMNLKIAKKVAQQKAFQETASGKLQEYTANIATVKSLGIGETLHKTVNTNEEILFQLQKKSAFLGTIKWWGIQGISDIALVLLLLMLGMDVVHGVVSIGSIALFYVYFKKTHDSLNDFSDAADGVIEAKYSFYRLTPLLAAFEKEKGTRPFPKIWKKIEVQNVHFKYKDTPVLSGINFTIKRGEKIGIVGGSGQGKSTLFKLLLNLYTPRDGIITIDGKDYTSISKRTLTKSISIVPQDVELFNTSLKENITLTNNEGNLHQALFLAECMPLVKRLPQGIDTVIGERGVRLSGGEKQRLGIARALYANTEILLLDESTSHLDSETEKKIQTNIEKNLKNKTVLLIAHRLSTLRNTDKIIVLDQGKIIQAGTYEELLKQKGKFASLAKLQKNKN